MTYEPRTEVYRFPLAGLIGSVVLAILLQAYLAKHLVSVALLDLPLLVVIYFGLTRRNPSSTLLLGLLVGVFQDALSPNLIGQYGMAKSVIGFATASVSVRLDVERPPARLLLVFFFYFLHQFAYVGIEQLLLGRSGTFFGLNMLEAALVNALLGVLVFHVLDRFRQPA